MANILKDPNIVNRINLMSQRTGVNPNLFHHQIMKESSGNPNAVGDGGKSIGLGQIYDPTWRMLQKQNPALKDRKDPMQNLQAMEDLWNMNLQKAGGDQYKALRMYNGSGPMAEKYASSLKQYLDGGDQIAAYNQGIGDAPTVQQTAAAGMVNPIQYTPRDFWEEFRRQDPLQGQRNYALDPITFESLAGYI